MDWREFLPWMQGGEAANIQGVYGDSLTFYMQMMFVPHRRHTYGTARLVTEMALLSYMQMMFVPHRRRTYGPPMPVTGIALIFYKCYDVRSSQ
jgi:hypothetical protein